MEIRKKLCAALMLAVAASTLSVGCGDGADYDDEYEDDDRDDEEVTEEDVQNVKDFFGSLGSMTGSEEPVAGTESPAVSETTAEVAEEPATVTEEAAEVPATDVAEAAVTESAAPEDAQDSYEVFSKFGIGYSTWEDGYRAYYNKYVSSYDGGYTYALIYVDNDDIPELVIDTGVEATGCQILSFYEGTVTVLQTNRLYFEYIERSGFLCNSEGHMGYYYDTVYKLDHGNWETVFNGEYYDFDESAEVDYDEETGRYKTLHYVVDGVEVDENTYMSKLKQVYNFNRSMPPQNYLLIDDLRSYLTTGKMSSADHSYELVVKDCTWEEAASACEDMGGHLASITCDDEFDRIDELIRSSDLTNICFYIGATNADGYSWHWTDPSLTQNSCLGNGFYKHWLNGSPSYTETLADGTEIREEYAEYIYIKSEDKFYINDVPSDVIGYYPYYKGRMGFICEYDY